MTRTQSATRGIELHHAMRIQIAHEHAAVTWVHLAEASSSNPEALAMNCTTRAHEDLVGMVRIHISRLEKRSIFIMAEPTQVGCF